MGVRKRIATNHLHCWRVAALTNPNIQVVKVAIPPIRTQSDVISVVTKIVCPQLFDVALAPTEQIIRAPNVSAMPPANTSSAPALRASIVRLEIIAVPLGLPT